MRLPNGDVLLRNPLEVMCITSAFPKYIDGKPHYGVDLRGAIGTPVYAAEDGVARWVQKWDGRTKTGDQSYGNAVILRHDPYNNGMLETVYAHLNALNVIVGQRVKEGDIIGWVGNTGNSYGSHLHFEVRYKSKKVQPLYWLNDKFSWASTTVKNSSGTFTSVVYNPVILQPNSFPTTTMCHDFEAGLMIQKMSNGDKEQVIALLNKLQLKYKEV